MDEAAIAGLMGRYALRSPTRPHGGISGERLGTGVGASLEFHDYRAYEPGDDLRHLDWSVYARTDELRVRLHREEVSPAVEVLLDTSASMASSAAKEQRARELASLFCRLARRDRYRPRLVFLAEPPRRIAEDLEEELQRRRFQGREGLRPGIRLPRAPRSLRLVISDLLVPESPRSLLGPLAGEAHFVGVIQVLDSEEIEPTFEGGHRLLDVESGESLDLLVSPRAQARYRERLAQLQNDWRSVVRGAPGALATVDAGMSLAEVARTVLVPAGILTVRSSEVTVS